MYIIAPDPWISMAKGGTINASDASTEASPFEHPGQTLAKLESSPNPSQAVMATLLCTIVYFMGSVRLINSLLPVCDKQASINRLQQTWPDALRSSKDV